MSGTNIYRYQFVSRCPVNNKAIVYQLEISTVQKIMVEHITICAALYDTAYHEEIADAFHKQFGGQQIIKAHHHGVDIETRRGFELPNCGRLTERVIVGKTVYEKGVDARLAIEAVSR
jgi:hypothetical protein